MPTLNLGILAHVDAGKTSLTERLLFTHGAITALGSVDAGSTTTDSDALERERGITIRSAVAPFTVGDLQVNLIDTPGHPDFIAEVERALAVLDAAVLVISAVEGVQAQTRVLMRSLRRLRLPTLIMVNKIDRGGARGDALLSEIRARLGVSVVAVNDVRDPGTPDARTVGRDWSATAAETLADHDDDLLARLVAGDPVPPAEVRDRLRDATAAGLLCPVLFGSAATGAGTGDLTAAVTGLLRPRPVTGTTPSGRIFAIGRGPRGEKIAYLRLFTGTVRERDRVVLHRPAAEGPAGVRGRITALEVVGGGRVFGAGAIARVHGLSAARVGDRLGPGATDPAGLFSPPGLESVVRPHDRKDQARLHAALLTLADEDPLIRVRTVPGGGTSVLLYGAVQREVLADRLARDFGLVAGFGPVTPVHVERLNRAGECVVALDPRRDNEFWATVGLRAEPGPPGSGLRYRRAVQPGAVPAAFHRATEEAVRRTLDQGRYGWEVVDCTVTVTRTGYRAPISTAADFRALAPIVLMRALSAAGTRVCEPGQEFEADVPVATLNAVLAALSGFGAEVTGSAGRDGTGVVTGLLPARAVPDLTAALPGLTHGEGAVTFRPGPDRPVRGPAPRRPRTDGLVW